MINDLLTNTSTVMTFPEVASMVIGICSIFIMVIIFMQKGRNAMLEENLKTMWKQIEENKCKISETDKHVDRNFHNKVEVREYVELLQAPILTQIKNMNNKLDNLQEMLQTFINTPKGTKKR